MSYLYAAYGSNMCIKQMAYRLHDPIPVGTGIIEGWKLVFRGHADIVRDASSCVPTVVWEIPDDDIDMLDTYEEYPTFREVKLVDVVLDDGRAIWPFTYVENQRYSNVFHEPDEQYLKTMLRGYEEHHIDTSYLYKALTATCEMCTMLK